MLSGGALPSASVLLLQHTKITLKEVYIPVGKEPLCASKARSHEQLCTLSRRTSLFPE